MAHTTLYIIKSHAIHVHIVYIQQTWNTHTCVLHICALMCFYASQHETHITYHHRSPSCIPTPRSFLSSSHHARLSLATLMLYLMWSATPCLSALVPRTHLPTGSRPCSTSRTPFQSTLVCTCLGPISCSLVGKEKREQCMHCITTHAESLGMRITYIGCTNSYCHSDW